MSKITALLMVRNEEELLPRCLASLAGAVDRVLLFDTGSDDGTLEVARDYAARTGFPPVTVHHLGFVDFDR